MFYPKKTLLLSTLAVSSFPVVANTIPNIPNAGQLLQQQSWQQYQPQAEVNIEEPQQMQIMPADSQQQIQIEQVVIQGNQSIATEDFNQFEQVCPQKLNILS